MQNRSKNLNFDILYECVLSLKDKEESKRFFEDLCTVQELKTLTQRLQVARMLNDSHVYSDIVEATGASTATISRVNRCLSYGSDGYAMVIERLKKDEL
jgi:TrpR-related protein YerC/YecD